MLTEIIARHEVLRSTVEVRDRQPVQVVHPVIPVPVMVSDISYLDPAEQRREICRRYDVDVETPFPADQHYRMRSTMLRLGPRTYVVLLTTHHASSDGWSMAVILREVAALYPAFLHGMPSPLPPPIQYGDFAVWQREQQGQERIAADLDYWKSALAGIPPRLALPADRAHPVRRSFEGGHYSYELGKDVTVAIQQFAEREGASISVLLLAACSVLLHRYTGQDDLVFGTAVTGRVRIDTEQVVGCFANALPLRVRVARTDTLLDVLRRARDVFSGALAHQDIPFDRLVEELAPKETSQTPLIQMMINVLTTPGDILRQADQVLEMEGLRISPEPVAPGPVPIDLSLNVQALPDLVHLQWHYATELFDHGTVVALADRARHVLAALISDPDRRVADLDLLGAPTAARPAPDAQPKPAFDSVVARVRTRAATAPDDPAVVGDDTVLSYAELSREAELLARRLHAVGVGRESVVALVVDSSPWQAVAALGVLAAGAAFVPVDPGLPRERMGAVAAGVGATAVVTTAALARLVDGAGGRVIVVNDPERVELDGDDPGADPAPGDAAYVAPTSGPAGVVIEHRSLAVVASEVAERLGLGAGDRFLRIAGSAVPAAEIFSVWLAGGAVVFPPSDGAASVDLDAVVELIRVSVIALPTADWHDWVRRLDAAGRALPRSLRLVIVGPEPVLPECLRMWQKLGVPLMNAYGSNGTTGSSTFFRLRRTASEADIAHLPIGTPLPSTLLRILDDSLREVPPGSAGELYVGGPGVGRGRAGCPGLTAGSFVADPYASGARLYRSGDIVRKQADGNLELVTRGAGTGTHADPSGNVPELPRQRGSVDSGSASVDAVPITPSASGFAG